MNTDPFRQQLNQRYIAEKILDGADTKEIADGFGDPVSEMETIVGPSATKSKSPRPANQPPAWGIFLLLCAVIVFLLLLLSNL